MAQHVENTGTSPLRFLKVFASSCYADGSQTGFQTSESIAGA